MFDDNDPGFGGQDGADGSGGVAFGSYDGSVPAEIRADEAVVHIWEIDDVTEKPAEADKPLRVTVRVRSLTQPEADSVFMSFSDFKPDMDQRARIMRQREINALCAATGSPSIRDKAALIGKRFKAGVKWRESGGFWNANFKGVVAVSDAECEAAGIPPI